jgi:hypothetical protein
MFFVLYVTSYIYYIQDKGRLRPPLSMPDDTADPAGTAGTTAAAVPTEAGVAGAAEGSVSWMLCLVHSWYMVCGMWYVVCGMCGMW